MNMVRLPAQLFRCPLVRWRGFHALIGFMLLLAGALTAQGAAFAQTIKLTGKTFDGASHDLTVEEIDSAGVVHEKVFNPYEKLRVRYAGVLLDRFVTRFGDPAVTSIKITAIDDYRIEFEKAEWEQYRILFVTRLRGERFGLEKKGPARIVYVDFDPEDEAFRLRLPNWLWMIQEVEFR